MNALTLRVRNADDLAQQLAYHRVNALADSLHRSCMVPVFSVPQTIPHGQQKADLSGSELAERLDTLSTELLTARQRVQHAQADWDREYWEAEYKTLERKALKVAAQLGTVKSEGQGHRPGVPGLYLVKVLPVRYTDARNDEQTGEVPAETYTLDTRELPDDLRDTLKVYLLSGVSDLPYWVNRKVRRYYKQNRVPADVLAMFSLLAMNLRSSSGAASSRLPTMPESARDVA